MSTRAIPISRYRRTSVKGKPHTVTKHTRHIRNIRRTKVRKVIIPKHEAEIYHPPKVPQIVDLIEARGATDRSTEEGEDQYRTLDYAARSTAMMNLGAYDSTQMKHTGMIGHPAQSRRRREEEEYAEDWRYSDDDPDRLDPYRKAHLPDILSEVKYNETGDGKGIVILEGKNKLLAGPFASEEDLIKFYLYDVIQEHGFTDTVDMHALEYKSGKKEYWFNIYGGRVGYKAKDLDEVTQYFGRDDVIRHIDYYYDGQVSIKNLNFDKRKDRKKMKKLIERDWEGKEHMFKPSATTDYQKLHEKMK